MICLKIINASLYNNRKLLSPAKNYVSNFFRYRNLTSNRGTFVFKIDGRIDVDRRITIDSASILRTKIPWFYVKFRYWKKLDALFLAGTHVACTCAIRYSQSIDIIDTNNVLSGSKSARLSEKTCNATLQIMISEKQRQCKGRSRIQFMFSASC